MRGSTQLQLRIVATAITTTITSISIGFVALALRTILRSIVHCDKSQVTYLIVFLCHASTKMHAHVPQLTHIRVLVIHARVHVFRCSFAPRASVPEATATTTISTRKKGAPPTEVRGSGAKKMVYSLHSHSFKHC